MMANKRSAVFFIIALSLLAYSNSNANWTMGNNTIKINTYESKLTEEQRDNYYYWIGLRNSFYYQKENNKLEKLVTYFAPEQDDYYSNLRNFIIPFGFCSGAVVIILVIYLVQRFLLKGCRGPKIIAKSYHNTTYFIIIFGFLLGFISLIVTLYNASKSE